MFLAFLIVLGLLFVGSANSFAASNKQNAQEVRGPVTATVVRVIDGDTVIVDALTWPGHSVRVSVRLLGIDAPEIRSRCAAVREAGYRARARLSALVGEAGTVQLKDIRGGKYYGRVLAAIITENRDVSSVLLADGLVQPYSGGKRYKPSCQ